MPTPKTALETATAALARRDRTSAELIELLERRGAGADDAVRAVGRLAAAGYVDDARFATDRAAVLAARDYGDEAIRLDLEDRGLSRDSIDAALAQLEAEDRRAVALAERLGATPATARRLALKGFSQAAVESALGRLGVGFE